ncbi:MAG: hypothetical protein KJZ84_04715 [Bryobacteraceae bacterium]|nr:hypothetical protein [Bryobacteraceae bacterium]
MPFTTTCETIRRALQRRARRLMSISPPAAASSCSPARSPRLPPQTMTDIHYYAAQEATHRLNGVPRKDLRAAVERPALYRGSFNGKPAAPVNSAPVQPRRT